MGARNKKSRASRNYMFANFNGQRFMLETGPFQTMNVVYKTKKKLLAGKLSIPNMPDRGSRTTILITCGEDRLDFSWI